MQENTHRTRHLTDDPTSGLTEDQARERLDAARAARVDDAADRGVHGLATAGFGAVIGVYVAVQQGYGRTAPWEGILVAGYVLVLLAITRWQTRAARVVPRHSRRAGRVGLAGTVSLMIASIVVLNTMKGTGWAGGADAAGSPWTLALVAVLVALPMIAAGALIRRGPAR